MPRQISPRAVVLALMVALIASSLAATGTAKPPVWPQKFSLAAGQTICFCFPLTKAGAVIVDLQWDKTTLSVGLAPVTVTQFNRSTKLTPILTSNASPSRSHLTFNPTAVQVSASSVWAIALTAPGNPPKPGVGSPAIAAGQITVTCPPPDMAKVGLALQGLHIASSRPRPSRQALAQATSAARALLAAHNKAQADKLAAADQAIQTQATKLATAAAARLNQSKLTLVRTLSTTPKFTHLKWNSRVHLLTGGQGTAARTAQPSGPAIISVSPVAGSPGDEITILASGVTTQLTQTNVAFNIQPQAANQISTFWASPVAAMSLGKTVQLKVAVPSPLGAPVAFTGTVYLQDQHNNLSAPVKFSFTPIPEPTVTGVVTAVGSDNRPGDGLVITGSGFRSDSKLYFLFAGTSQSEVVSPNFSPETGSSMVGTIPNYPVAQPGQFWASVFIRNHYKSTDLETDVDSVPFPVLLNAAGPTLTATSVSQVCPGSWIYLTGQGFGDSGEVFMAKSAGGNFVNVPEKAWSDTSVMCQVPRWDGFGSPITAQVYIQCGRQKSATLPIVVNPQMVYQYIDLSKYQSDWDFEREGDADMADLSPDGTMIEAWHEDDKFWFGSSGTDEMFYKTGVIEQMTGMATMLKNGWTVSSVDWWQEEGNDLYQSLTCTSFVGTNDPDVRIDWSISAIIGFSTHYRFSIEIYGPQGCDYF